jgi:hypothetical protein
MNDMHPLTRIRRALAGAKKRATEGGALHPLWEVIADAERALEGGAFPASRFAAHPHSGRSRGRLDKFSHSTKVRSLSTHVQVDQHQE